MVLRNKFDQALLPQDRKTRVANLHAIIKDCIAAGLKRKEIEQLFSQIAHEMRAENREEDEDLLLECLDVISGWCSPGKYIPGLDYSDK